jgi:hypothetical protein
VFVPFYHVASSIVQANHGIMGEHQTNSAKQVGAGASLLALFTSLMFKRTDTLDPTKMQSSPEIIYCDGKISACAAVRLASNIAE